MKIEITREWTRGWKGYLGAGLTMLVGIYLMAVGEKIAGMQLIAIGLALLGIRHKLDYMENNKKNKKKAEN
jgi:hypothetical protein